MHVYYETYHPTHKLILYTVYTLPGVPHIGGGSDAGRKVELKSGYALPHDADVGAVIVG